MRGLLRTEQQEHETLREDLVIKENELAALQERVGELEDELASTRTALHNQASQAQKTEGDLKSTLAQRNLEVERLSKRADALEQDLLLLRQQRNQLETQKTSLQEEVNAARERESTLIERFKNRGLNAQELALCQHVLDVQKVAFTREFQRKDNEILRLTSERKMLDKRLFNVLHGNGATAVAAGPAVRVNTRVGSVGNIRSTFGASAPPGAASTSSFDASGSSFGLGDEASTGSLRRSASARREVGTSSSNAGRFSTSPAPPARKSLDDEIDSPGHDSAQSDDAVGGDAGK